MDVCLLEFDWSDTHSYDLPHNQKVRYRLDLEVWRSILRGKQHWELEGCNFLYSTSATAWNSWKKSELKLPSAELILHGLAVADVFTPLKLTAKCNRNTKSKCFHVMKLNWIEWMLITAFYNLTESERHTYFNSTPLRSAIYNPLQIHIFCNKN